MIQSVDSLDLAKLSINDQPPLLMQSLRPDSMLVALPPGFTASTYRFIYDGDTLLKLSPENKQNTKLVIEGTGTTKWRSGDSLAFRVNDPIVAIDTSLILVRNEQGVLVPYYLEQDQHRFTIVPNAAAKGNFTVRFEPGVFRED